MADVSRMRERGSEGVRERLKPRVPRSLPLTPSLPLSLSPSLVASPDLLAAAAVALFVLVGLALARAHRMVGLSVETDFYAFYVPDAALLRRGMMPTHSFSGPGYPALLALLGSWLGDDFVAAKA